MTEELSIPIPVNIGDALPEGTPGDIIIYQDGEWTAQDAPSTSKNLRILTVNYNRDTTDDNFESIGQAIQVANTEFDALVDSNKITGSLQGGGGNEVILESGSSDENDTYVGYIIRFYEGPGIGLESMITAYDGESRTAIIAPGYEMSYTSATKYHLLDYRVARSTMVVVSPGEYYENLTLSRGIRVLAMSRGSVVINGNHIISGSATLENLSFTSLSSDPILYTNGVWHPYDSTSNVVLRNCTIAIAEGSTPAIILSNEITRFEETISINITLQDCVFTAINNETFETVAIEIGQFQFFTGTFIAVPHSITLIDTDLVGSIVLLSSSNRSITMQGGTMHGVLKCYYGNVAPGFIAASFVDVRRWRYLNEEDGAIIFKNNYITNLPEPTDNQGLHVILRNVNFEQPAAYSPLNINLITSDDGSTGNTVRFNNVSMSSRSNEPTFLYNTVKGSILAMQDAKLHQEVEVSIGEIPRYATRVGLSGSDQVQIPVGLYEGHRMTIIKRDGISQQLIGAFGAFTQINFQTICGSAVIEWSAKYDTWSIISIVSVGVQ
jgi:hypothetical protein